MHDVDPGALSFDLDDRLAECLERSVRVGFDDQTQLGFVGAKLLEKIGQSFARIGRCVQSCVPLGLQAIGSDGARFPIAPRGLELVAGGRDIGPSHYQDRRGRPGFLHTIPRPIHHRPDSPCRGPGDKGVAGVEGSALDDDCGGGAHAGIELGFDHNS